MNSKELHRHLSIAYKSIRKGLTNSQPSRIWLAQQGIDPSCVPVGLSRGRFHRGDKKSEVAAFVEIGLLHSPDKIGRYLSFAKDHLLFPLFDKDDQMINFYAVNPDEKLKHTQLLNNNEGCYPRFPNQQTTTLFFAYDILATARMMSKNISIDGLTLTALNDGRANEIHLQLISELPFLKRIVVPTFLAKEQQLLIKEHIVHSRSEVELVFSDELETMLVSEKEITNDNSISHITAGSGDDNITFEIITPSLFILKNETLTIEVLGGVSVHAFDRLQVTLKITVNENTKRSFRDSLNLYQHASLTALVKETTDYLQVETGTLEKLLDYLVYYLEQYRITGQEKANEYSSIELTDKEKQDALALLNSPNLMQNLYEGLLNNIGIVGEDTNRLVTFLVMTSRKLDNPLQMVNYGSTGTGKSALIEMVAQCMPEEDYIELTSTSSKAFFHWREYGLQHKLILIQDIYDLSDEVMYQIRELQSKRKLTRTVTIKNKDSGFETILKTIYGPVCVIASSTADAIYPDNANRSIEIIMDESSEQDTRIVERQKQMAAKSVKVLDEERTKNLLKNSQRLLKHYPVMNPYATYLDIPQTTFKKRRTNAIYLGLIETITLLNQYRRKRHGDAHGTEYLLTEIEDIQWANKMIETIFLRKSDPLSQAERNFLEELKTWLEQNKLTSFSQQEIVKGLRKHPSTVKRYITLLQQHGYLFISGGDRYKKGYTYTLSEEQEYETLRTNIRSTLEVNLKKAKENSLEPKTLAVQ